MKPIVLHPGSVAAGIALTCAGLFVASAQTPHVGRVLPPKSGPIEVHIVGIPDPRVMIRIEEGTPYVVPAGKLFVVTAVGATTVDPGGFARANLKVDGVVQFQTSLVWNWSNATSPTSLQQVPPHLVAPPGSTVEVDTGNALPGRALGYLLDE